MEPKTYSDNELKNGYENVTNNREWSDADMQSMEDAMRERMENETGLVHMDD